jgi:hypothetical protein
VDWVEPNVCTDEHIGVDDAGLLRLEPWSVPRLVSDVRSMSAADGKVGPELALPGKLLIEQQTLWTNTTPVDMMMLIRITRSFRTWITSNPNALQFRDRWTHAVDRQPSEPVTTGIFNSQAGSAIDLGTNSVAEPNPGKQWIWTPTHCADEWVGPLEPGQTFRVWYRSYVWTPPPWSDNANKNSPQHEAAAGWARIQLISFPTPGRLVIE